MDAMTQHLSPHPSVAIVSTYPPTQCGLATFSAALRSAMQRSTPDGEVSIVEVVASRRPSRREVVQQVVKNDPTSVGRGAQCLKEFDAVIVQHEFGIFGGTDGDEVLDLLVDVTAPFVVVLHTVLVDPTPHQRDVLEVLCRRASTIVVMTEAARTRLIDGYDVDADAVIVIPHGAHENREIAREIVDEDDHCVRPTILTWGLLGPGKGIEAGIDALVELRDLIPAPRYLVAGETHPNVKAACGESYRQSLIDRARRNGVGHMVEFDDCYRDVASLNALIRSCDVVLVPYESRDQVTSGVLIEAVASGRPVVATEFPHARELLSSGAGITVPHESPHAIAAALRRVLTDHRLARRMSNEARRISAPMMWDQVAVSYLTVVSDLVLGAQLPATRHGACPDRRVHSTGHDANNSLPRGPIELSPLRLKVSAA
jgi:polysaccharide biosynthesis protein PslF